MILAISSIALLWLLGLSLAMYNLKVLKATKRERLEQRRAYKKIKNERLRKMYGLDKK